MKKYEKFTSISGTDFIRRQNDDGSVSDISLDESNSDYQRYLRWLENPDAEEGGTL